MLSPVSTTSALFAVLWAFLLGGGGALLTRLDGWYRQLRKPAWQPPDFLFGPVWTVIFILAAVAAILGWNSPLATSESRTRLIVAYLLNAVLNLLWSHLFFRRHRPDWALREVPILWLSILLVTALLWPQSRLAALLLAPYLAWVAFASVLNRAIVRLNPISAHP